MKSVDLNADIGEGYKSDKELLKYISSANIACGLHAGSPPLITQTIRMAKNKGVAIGAHPGYPDRKGFGRTRIDMPAGELFSYIIYQIGALDALAKAEGIKMTHVKAHGALYNSAVKDKLLAKTIIEAIKNFNPLLLVFGPSGSEIEKEALNNGMRFVSEVFADRAYNDDSTLVSRGTEGAIIRDVNEASSRALTMIKTGLVKSISGKDIKIKAQTICLHGDNNEAIAFARSLYSSITDSGLLIKPYSQIG